MSQCEQILQHLKRGRVVSAYDALQRFGCLRLAARIADLRERGHDIRTRMVATSTGKHIACYWLHRNA